MTKSKKSVKRNARIAPTTLDQPFYNFRKLYSAQVIYFLCLNYNQAELILGRFTCLVK